MGFLMKARKKEKKTSKDFSPITITPPAPPPLLQRCDF